MSTGQTMITAGFLVLVMVLSISANSLILDSMQSSIESEALESGTLAADELLEEIAKKKFDQYAVTTYYQATSEFTSPSALGPSATERIATLPESEPYQSIVRFHDVEDYNGYSRMVTVGRVTNLRLSARVYYITTSNTTTASSTQTYFKRVDVTISQTEYFRRNISLSRVITY